MGLSIPASHILTDYWCFIWRSERIVDTKYMLSALEHMKRWRRGAADWLVVEALSRFVLMGCI